MAPSRVGDRHGWVMQVYSWGVVPGGRFLSGWLLGPVSSSEAPSCSSASTEASTAEEPKARVRGWGAEEVEEGKMGTSCGNDWVEL